jgi:glycosyltransferase involved in cell wall biosynthesis
MSSVRRSGGARSGKPRIVLTITRLIVGGAQFVVLGLCEALRDEFDVHVLCGPEAGSEGSIRADVERLAPVTVVPHLRREIHPVHDVACVAELRRVYEHLEPDLIHSHSSKAGIVSRFASTSQAKVVHTVHGWGHTPVDRPMKKRAFVALERLAARRADALVAVSADVLDEGLALGIGRPEQYHLIPPGVDFRPRSGDFQVAREHARRELGIDSDERVVGWVGRFVPAKDPATLVKTLTRLLDADGGPSRAVLVGDGPLRAEAEEQLARFGRRVLFTGLRRDARELYPAFDVLLHASRWEGQPLVVQEALAERVPVVATRVPGVSDLVGEDGRGFVVEPEDVSALERRVMQVLGEPGLRAPLPTAAIEQLAERNGQRASGVRLAELYRELIDRGPVRAPAAP